MTDIEDDGQERPHMYLSPKDDAPTLVDGGRPMKRSEAAQWIRQNLQGEFELVEQHDEHGPRRVGKIDATLRRLLRTFF